MAFEVGAIVSKLVLDLKDWKKSVKIVQADIDKTRKRFKKTGESSVKLGKTLTRSVTLPLIAMGAAAIKAALDINEGLARVGTLIPGQVRQLEIYKKQIQSLGPAMGKSAGDLTSGLFQVISAIGKTGKEMKILEINARAGAAGMSTTEEAIRLTTAVTKGYGDISEQAFQKAADLAFKTNELGQTTFPELASSMGRVIPVAAAMNVSQEELFASMATLTGVTGNAAEVSTQMAGILRALIKPTDNMKKAIKTLGFSSADALVQQEGLVGGMRKLIGSTNGSKEAIGKLFRRAEALTAVFALTEGQAETFNVKLKKMQNVTGSTDKAFNEITSGINKTGFQFKQLIQKVVVLAQEFGDKLMPAFQVVLDILGPFLGVVGDLVRGFGKLPKFLQVTIIGLIGVAAAIGPVIFLIGKLNIVMALLPAKIVAVGSAMTLSFGAWMVIIAAVIIATKALFNAIEAGQKRALALVAKRSNADAEYNKQLIRFMAQASEAEKTMVRNSIAAQMALGLSRQVATNKTIELLRKESGAFQEFEKVKFESVRDKLARIKAEEEAARLVREAAIKTAADKRKLDASNWVTLNKEITNRIKELQLGEFEFRKELAIQKAAELDKEVEKTAGAAEKKKIIAQQLDLELAQIALDKKTRQKELDEQERLREEEKMEFVSGLVLQRQTLEAEEFEGRVLQLDAWRAKQLEVIGGMNLDYGAAKTAQAEIDKIYDAKKEALEKAAELKRKQRNKQIISAAMALGQNLLGLWSALLSARLKTLNETYSKERQWIEDNVTDEEEKKKKLEELEKAHAEKTNAIKRKQAFAEKAGGIASAIINTASGIMTAYAQLGAFALPMAILIGAAGAAQIATIVATPIPFAEGGITTGATQGLIGEAGPEAVIPLDRLPEIFAEMGGFESEGGGFGEGGLSGTTNINITIAAMDSEDVAKFVDDKLIPILEDRFETQNFQVDPIAVRS